MNTAQFQLEPLSRPSCIIKIEKTLEKTCRVEEARVLFNSNNVKVEYDEMQVSEEVLQEMIEKLGYPVVA
jgi:copper chaperone CopZ